MILPTRIYVKRSPQGGHPWFESPGAGLTEYVDASLLNRYEARTAELERDLAEARAVIAKACDAAAPFLPFILATRPRP